MLYIINHNLNIMTRTRHKRMSVLKSSVSLHIILQACVIVYQNDRVKGFELIFFVHSNAVILFCIIYPKKGNLSVLYEKLPRTAFHYVVHNEYNINFSPYNFILILGNVRGGHFMLRNICRSIGCL